MAVSSQKQFRVGIIGAGHISEFHIRALKRTPNVEIIGVTDLDRGRAEAMSRAHQLPTVFGTLDELLASKPDVVHVLTPPSAHVGNAVQALEHGCHVLIEKPLADTVEGCDQIAAAAEANGKVVCVDHSLLRDPFVQRALNLVRSGAIGDVLSVDHLRSQFYPNFSGGKVPEAFRAGGFPFRDIGVHSLYLLEAFLGEIRSVSAHLGSPENDGYPRYKEWRVTAECARGFGQIYLSWSARPLQDMLIIHGTRGVIRADIFGMSVTARRKGRLPEKAERILNAVGEGARTMTQVTANVGRFLTKRLLHYHGLQTLVAEFYTKLAAGEAPPVGVSDARRIVAWTEHVAQKADDAKQRYVARFATRGTAETLVTGATGFIGRHLLDRLLQERERVRILVRRTPKAEIFESDRVETFLGDLGDPADVDRACRGVKEVFHLGATVEGHAEDFQCATMAGTQNIIDSCLHHGVEKLIYMSSLSVIHAAAASGKRGITEDWPFEPYPERRGLYTQTKLAAERLVSDAVQNRGLKAVLLRPGEVLGPDKLFLSGAVGREAGGRVLVLGNGKSILPLIWVEDLVDAIIAAAERARFEGEAFNLVDPQKVTQDDFAAHYLAAKKLPKRIAHLPLFMLYPAAAALKIALGLLGKDSPITPYRLSSALGSRQFDCTAAEQGLGWTPRIGIRAGMESVLHGGPRIENVESKNSVAIPSRSPQIAVGDVVHN